MTHEDARALCDAGYMPLSEYLRLCRDRGWASAEPVSVTYVENKFETSPRGMLATTWLAGAGDTAMAVRELDK